MVSDTTLLSGAWWVKVHLELTTCKNMYLYINRLCIKEELFTLCHSSAHNIIKCIFGMLKYKYHTLHTVPKYNISIQAHIPIALAILHNFNWKYEDSEANPANEELSPIGELMVMMRWNTMMGLMKYDKIVVAIWTQYLEEHIYCGIPLHVLIVETEACEMYSKKQLNIPTRNYIRSKCSITCANHIIADWWIVNWQ